MSRRTSEQSNSAWDKSFSWRKCRVNRVMASLCELASFETYARGAATVTPGTPTYRL